MNGFDAITATIIDWDAAYTDNIEIGYNMTVEDFEDRDARETEQVWVSYQGTSPHDPFEDGSFCLETENFTVYLRTLTGLDKANSLAKYFQEIYQYTDTTWGVRKLSLDNMTSIKGSDNIEYFALNLVTN